MSSAVTGSKNLIDSFIDERVIGQGLDRRTEKAYRMDLEHFYIWLGQKKSQTDSESDHRPLCGDVLETEGWEAYTRSYLDYLAIDKKLSSSTIYRKIRVLGYYLSYLSKEGMISEYYPPVRYLKRKATETVKKEYDFLSKKDADTFFAAMNQEYERLSSEFRRRVCLRDMVMMELLFYHKIEISELLRMETEDYDIEKGNLLIRRKRGTENQVYLYSKELRQKMKLWLEERELFRQEGNYENILFLSKFGKPLSMEMVVKIFDKYRNLAGIKKELTPKDLKEGVMKGYARGLVMERWG